MPYRTFPFWVTVLGVMAVAACWLFRVNLNRLAETSPAFARRLLVAGMMCLYSLGIVSTGFGEEGGRWQKIGTTWQEAQEVASGKRGPFPFDRAGKQKMLEELGELSSAIDTLAHQKVISETETELLKLDLQVLITGVEAKRPKELEVATCYQPMLYTPELDSLGRLEKRLPLLNRLEPGKVSPEVWNKIIAGLQKDLGVLRNPDHLARLKAPDKARASEVADKVEKEIDRLGQTSVPVVAP